MLRAATTRDFLGEVGARYTFGVANKPEVLEEYPLEQVLEPGIFISRITPCTRYYVTMLV